jgi:hypothetical protein
VSEAVRVDVGEGITRCPFCHETVAAESDDWIACKGCLARHHQGCWNEGKGCSSCHGTIPLAPARDASGPAAGTSLGAVSTPRDARRETAHLLEREARKTEGVIPAVLAIPTAGISGVIAAERALRRHRRRNALEELRPLEGDVELAAKVEAARERAVSGNAKSWLATFAFPMLALAAFGNAIFMLIRVHDLNDPGALPLAFLFYALGWIVLATHLHLHRAAVRRHERDQAYVSLVSSGTAPDEAKALLGRFDGDWQKLLIPGVGATLFGLVPWFGLLALPGLAILQHLHLRTHETHEEELARLASKGKV